MGIKKTILLIGICLIIGFMLGSIAYAFTIFPFGQGYYVYTMKKITPAEDLTKDFCQNHITTFEFYGDAAKQNLTAPKIFLGDSLVSMIRDNNFFPNMSYRPIGSSGMVNKCLPYILDDVLLMKPEKILFYNGGNDADGQGRQTVLESIESHKQFVIKLKENDIEVVILGINYASQNRDKLFVQELNEGYEKTAKELQIQYIPPFDKLDFQNKSVKDNSLTYEGEHLKYDGYLKWFSHIDQYLSDFKT